MLDNIEFLVKNDEVLKSFLSKLEHELKQKIKKYNFILTIEIIFELISIYVLDHLFSENAITYMLIVFILMIILFASIMITFNKISRYKLINHTLDKLLIKLNKSNNEFFITLTIRKLSKIFSSTTNTILRYIEMQKPDALMRYI